MSFAQQQYALKRRARRAPPKGPQTKRSQTYFMSRANAAMLLKPTYRARKEIGYVDLAASTYNCDTTGTITLLTTIAQGAGITQRVGKRVSLKSLQCKGRIYAGSAGVIAQADYIIVYDKRPTGTLPAITDVLNTASSYSFNNDANSGRFVTIKRGAFTLIGNSTTPSTGCESYDIDFYVSLKGLPQVFKAAGTGAIADIEEGALYLITVGDVVAGTTAGVLGAGFRTRFVDQ